MIENYTNLFVASSFAKTHIHSFSSLKSGITHLVLPKMCNTGYLLYVLSNIFKQFSRTKHPEVNRSGKLWAFLFIDPRITMYKVVNPSLAVLG